MNITEHEMRGLLAGKCLPGDMRVNEELPAYLVRKFAELKAERDAQAAEAAYLRDEIKQHSECTHFCEVCGKDDPCKNDDVCWALNHPLPTTDAFLNSVRADAIDSAAEKAGEFANKCKVGSSTWHKWKSVVMFLVGESHALREAGIQIEGEGKWKS